MLKQGKNILSALTVASMLGVMLSACGGDNAATTVPAAATAATGAVDTAVPAAGTAAAGAATAVGGAADTAVPAEGTGVAGGTTPTEAAAAGATAATGGTTGGGTAMTLPADCSNVQISYWNSFSGPDGAFMTNLVNQFNSKNSNIKVTQNIIPGAQYATKLGTAQASDQLPDVVQVNEDQIALQAFNHVTRQMDDVVKQMGLGASDFPDIAWKTGQVAGHTYGVPLSFVVMTMYYNEDLLKKAGITAPPTNADEFAKAAAAVTSGPNHGFMITTGFPVQQIFQQLLHQYGGTEYSADGTQATWNSDAGVKALTWMKDAQTKYSAPKLAVDADLNAFKAGQVGMIWNGIWQLPSVTGSSVDFAGKPAATPQIGPQAATWGGAAYLALGQHKQAVDKCRDAASAMLIRYISDNSIEWAKGGNVPANNAVRNSAEFKAMPQGVLAQAAEHLVFPPPIPGIGDAFAPLMDAVGSIMSGTSTDIKGALDQAASRSNQVLKQNHDKYGDAPTNP
jgi:multiple sugar transport system substrate-binding protein